MIFKTRPELKNQFDVIHNCGLKNLIVSGCSFTYNNHESAAVTWPYYLRDVGGFDQVFDCSLPGAGNYHIANSLQWAIEVDQPDPTDSLVIVMWASNDRDDYLCPTNNYNFDYPFSFKYSENVFSGITGGNQSRAQGTVKSGLRELASTKSAESRAIENYLLISGCWHFLKSKGFRSVFLNYMNNPTKRNNDKGYLEASDFSIKPFLPSSVQSTLDQMITNIPSIYEWAGENHFLSNDSVHPSPNGYLEWTKQILLPKLQTIID